MLLFFGGSFDPVHIGHLVLARDVRETFSYEKVIFIPTYISPFKVKRGHSAPPEDRVKMLQLAIKGLNYFDIDTYEVERKEISYTIYTVLHLRSKYGLEFIHWLMGDDTFLNFHKWFEWKKLLKLIVPVVVVRTSAPEEILKYARETLELNPERLRIYSSRRIDISSTEIRNRIRNGRDIRYLVPEEVEAYIREKGLYL
ncbi:MAG TPA: nicotinate (nicotinamide) nucleotide adenylyltransferase [Aquificales bacterium]|nr:nicotinate (nicotinamide) nucleotide adenylyltransferase [Aquificales bacterium]